MHEVEINSRIIHPEMQTRETDDLGRDHHPAGELENTSTSSDSARDELDKYADQLLASVLALDKAELQAEYAKAHPGRSARQRIREIVDQAAALCAAQGKAQPLPLRHALASLSQLELPLLLDPTADAARVCILLIDQDADRLMVREELFLKRRINVETAMTLQDGLSRLKTGGVRLVIVDYDPNPDEVDDLMSVLACNLRVPVINVSAWTSFFNADEKQHNRDLLRAVARLLYEPVPRRSPVRRPAASAQSAAGPLECDLDFGVR